MFLDERGVRRTSSQLPAGLDCRALSDGGLAIIASCFRHASLGSELRRGRAGALLQKRWMQRKSCPFGCGRLLSPASLTSLLFLFFVIPIFSFLIFLSLVPRLSFSLSLSLFLFLSLSLSPSGNFHSVLMRPRLCPSSHGTWVHLSSRHNGVSSAPRSFSIHLSLAAHLFGYSFAIPTFTPRGTPHSNFGAEDSSL